MAGTALRFFLAFAMGIVASVFVFIFFPLTLGILAVGVFIILREPEMFFTGGLVAGFILGIVAVFAYPNIFVGLA